MSVIAAFVNDYAAITAAGTGTISVLILFYRRCLKPMFTTLKRLNESHRKIDIIFSEMTPNGGSSIKDDVKEIRQEIIIVRERQRALAADGAEAIFETDATGNYIWVNRTYTRLVGRDISEVLGHGWQNTIAPEDQERVITEWYKAVKEHREFSDTFDYVRTSGTRITCKVRSIKLTHKGTLLGYIGRVSTIG